MSGNEQKGTDAELAVLCRSCGLCCDGSLFGRVALEPDELVAARRMRLDVLDNASAFEQPCTALSMVDAQERRACTIYRDRPHACRRFVCRLHERHRREGGAIEQRLAGVQRARELIAIAFDARRSRAPMDRDSVIELRRRLDEDFAREPGT